MPDQITTRDFVEALNAQDERMERRFTAHTESVMREITEMKAENARDHATVAGRLEKIETGLTGVVTWRSLGFAITTTGALSAIVAATVSLVG